MPFEPTTERIAPKKSFTPRDRPSSSPYRKQFDKKPFNSRPPSNRKPLEEIFKEEVSKLEIKLDLIKEQLTTLTALLNPDK